MKELTIKINELEKTVKQLTASKQKKYMSIDTKQHFTKVLTGIDELNRDVLNYKGTNIFLYAKFASNTVDNNYVQF